jgi:hypothetical protein
MINPTRSILHGLVKPDVVEAELILGVWDSQLTQ